MNQFFPRKIYLTLSKHLKNKQITVITGMRCTGKTTLVNKLLSDIKSDNKIYFDLQRIDNQDLFKEKNFDNIILQFQQRGLNIKQKMYIALDEVQLLPDIAGVIKYLYDHYNIKFIITGSSSYYLKNLFTESLSGRKKVFELYPLDFGEFLTFKSLSFKSIPLLAIKTAKFDANEYNRLKFYYEEFIQFGGFPEVVLQNDRDAKKDLLLDILSSYINIDIKLLTDFRKLDSLNKLIKLLATRVGSKIDYTKISSVIGVSRIIVKDYLTFLESTYLIKTVSVFTASIDREITKAKKVYFCDNGLINVLAEVGSGEQFENIIFNQLFHQGKINYFSLKSGQEIDFILNQKICLECKETPTLSDKKILQKLSTLIKIKSNFLIGRHPNKNFTGYIWGGMIR